MASNHKNPHGQSTKLFGNIKKGALHAELGVAQDMPIAMSQLNMAMAHAKKAGDTQLMRRINFAKNAHKFSHGK